MIAEQDVCKHKWLKYDYDKGRYCDKCYKTKEED